MNYLHFTPINQILQKRTAFFLKSSFVLILLLIFIKISPASLEVLSSEQSGITLRLTVEGLSISEQRIDGKLYHTLSYKDCQYTYEPSNPKIPVSRVMLGVPVSADYDIRVIDSSPAVKKYGYRVLPVPKIGYHQSQDKTPPVTRFIYEENVSTYQSDEFYPQKNAKIVNHGFIRNQRIITVELRPIQYSPRRRTIKMHSTLTVRVDFHIPPSAPGIVNRSFIEESPQFENLYQANLINYADAKKWRALPSQPQAAPKLQDEFRHSKSYKIYVEKTGIYRLTYEELRDRWNIDLSGYDPRNFSMLNRGKEIRIYVSGESDGSFDEGDYIEFLGIKSDSRYTRWNVYWLVYDSQDRGTRVAEMEGQPSEPTAKIVPSFRSKLYFEKDRLHSVLQHVRPEEVSGGDPHAWFSAVDSWYWTGVKNSSEKTEVSINFKLYDVAQSFEQPEINVLLQGGTPAEHEALVSINDVKIAVTKWSSQDQYLASKLLHSSYSIVDSTSGDNIIRLSKVDSDVNKDAMKYPYHFYINRFDIEYTRLLYAVNDQLVFKTPRTKEEYSVRKIRKLEYTVKHFLSPEIEVFEYENDMLVARIRNVEVNQVNLTPEDRSRLIEMFRSNQRALEEDSFAQETLNPLFVDPINVPDSAYNATFQYPDSHDANFIAVSAKAILRPARIEPNTFSSLPGGQGDSLHAVSNQADYIIITHPNFLDSAKRLADWRSTQKGGAHRTAVVDVTDIYDEFNYGMVDPQAIKDFLTYAFFNWTPPKVANVVIFGDGTYDFRGLKKDIYDAPPELTGFIPSHYMWSIYGQTATDHWFATVSGIDALPDFFIGRIPVEKEEEAQAVVDKFINYETNPVNGPWRRRIISVADDDVTESGDFIFRQSLEEISQNHTLLGYSTTKIYLEDIIKKLDEDPSAFEEGHLPGPVARKMITEELSKGAVLIQYSGHGSPKVWAHEIIFDNNAVKRLNNSDKLPFVIVLSCYNGYFDRPGEPSMAETFLRLPQAGSIGMFSATRLTFGSGNEALNKIVFDEIFRRNMRTLGEVCFSAKVETMVKEGISQLEMMQDYTLFGDPAMELLLADYEVQPELEKYTVGPEQKIQLKEGRLYKTAYNKAKHQKEYIPINDFSGKLTVTVRFPGYKKVIKEGLEIKKTANVVNGKYPSISISVPSSVKSGRGVVEYYAESLTEVAVGGVSFSVEVPKILDVKTELMRENSFVISVLISDELDSAGIEEVQLEWYDPDVRRWQTTPLKAEEDLNQNSGQQSGNWYSHNPPINLPENGRAVKYIIRVRDLDGNTVSSDTMKFQPMEGEDFHVVNETESFEPLIYYEIDYQNKKRFLKAEIENLEDNEVSEPVEVQFYQGNPDLNEDYLIDESAHLIGKTTVSLKEWQRRNPIDKYRTSITGEPPRAFELAPLNTNWIAVASIEVGQASRLLENGTHRIFVYVDPSKSISETDEKNNISDRTIELNSQFVGGKDLRVFSNDRVFDVLLPAGIKKSATSISLVPLTSSEFPEPVNQPDLEKIAFPFNQQQPVGAYWMKLYKDSQTVDQSSITNLSAQATVYLRFDLQRFRESTKNKIGLGGILDSELTEMQEEQVKQAMNDEAKNISMFIWSEESRKWSKLDSEVLFDESGNISVQLSPVIRQPSSEVNSSSIEVVLENSTVPTGKWVAKFSSPNQYDLYFAKEGEQLEKVESELNLYESSELGIRFKSRSGIDEFEFGDKVVFETVRYSEKLNLINLTSSNSGNGGFRYIKVEDSAVTADQWVVLFMDESRFWLEGEKNGIVKQNGRIGEEFVAPFGIRFIIDAGSSAFEAGDSLRFETRPVGRVRSVTNLVGKFTLMISSDTIPPDVQFTVAGQNFANGDAVGDDPQIQATISDDNGVDLFTRKMEFLISENNRGFVPVSQDEYQVSTYPGANQVVLNYNPHLSPGGYQLSLKIYDLSGNESQETMEFHVNKTTQLQHPMNYPNPFRTKEGTTITCEVTNEVDSAMVKIYTLSGRLIRQIEEEDARTIGFLEFHWDGRDYDGQDVANGVYYAKIVLKREDEADLVDYVKIYKLR